MLEEGEVAEDKENITIMRDDASKITNLDNTNEHLLVTRNEYSMDLSGVDRMRSDSSSPAM